MTRRAPVTTGRLDLAADTLALVAAGRHPGVEPNAWNRMLAAGKLGELVDQAGGIYAGDPDVARALAADEELERARWMAP